MIANFHTKLQSILIERNLSQRKIAIAIGVTQQTFNSYIKGECYPSLQTYKTLCEVLNISADYLLGL